jgi:hypothetical protein
MNEWLMRRVDVCLAVSSFVNQGCSELVYLKDFVNHCGVMVREQFKRFGHDEPGEIQSSSNAGATAPISRLKRWALQPFTRPKSIRPMSATGEVRPSEAALSQGSGDRAVHDRAVHERAVHDSIISNPIINDPAIHDPTVADEPEGRSHPAPKAPKPPRRKKPKPRSGWRWSIVCLAMLGVISGMGSAALLWLVSLPPPPDCEDSTSLTLDMERLYCAQQAIDTGGLPELIAGLEMLKQWTPGDALYPETQKLAEEWSKRVLAIARTKIANSDLEGALEAIGHIPETTPVYEDAQRVVEYWQRQWAEGEAIHAQAQEALKTQNWTLVSQKIAEMADLANPYWHEKRANELAQQLGVERRARQLLIQAQRTAEEGSLRALGQAITQAQEVTQGTFAWEDARNLFKKWSQTLLTDANQKWEAGDPRGALGTLQLAKVTTSVPELQDLVGFRNAYQLANQSILSRTPSANWVPSMQQLWSLREALFAMQKIPADSPFYEQAQTIQANLQAQWNDLVQLHYASLTASLGQHAFFHLAIDQAQQIALDRPRRLQAQTLIAHWRDQIERIEDQPYLDRAIALAQNGRIEDLQLAIAEASQVPQGRALRLTAQGHIANWRQQIETIEDKPYLDRARLFADEGNLREAIAAAQNIASGRALYNEAQAAIADWQAQMVWNTQMAEDRPILSRAQSLASSGDLSGAIRVASQIGSGRPLYREAQGAIADWQAQLNPPRREADSRQRDEDWLDRLNNQPESSEEAPALFPETVNPRLLQPGIPSPSIAPVPVEGSPFAEPELPDRIETVPPAAPPINVAPPEPSPPIFQPPPIEERFPPPSPAAPQTAPPPAGGEPFEGYYDERFFESD